jgi:hypothetical protein
MKFFSFSSSVAALAALSTLVSAIPTGDVSKRADGQVLDGLLRRDASSLDARQKADIASSALGFIEAILKQVERDNEVSVISRRLPPSPLFLLTQCKLLQTRGAFTQEIVRRGREEYPGFNWVICHVKHDKRFDGTQGNEWGHTHREVDIKIGGTIGYAPIVHVVEVVTEGFVLGSKSTRSRRASSGGKVTEGIRMSAFSPEMKETY